ncbi:MAG: tyrosine-type recombinase/integrase [Cyanothece sp. SIO1E1]|nr:tyrosine-type recombinase/integrase [Cyanothece sp. SIO1E1]
MPRLPKPRFNLKSPKAKSETLIFLVFRYRGNRLLYSTSLSIHPKEWNAKIQRPVALERRPDLWAIKRQLDDLAHWCQSIYIESEYGRITTSDFKKQLDQHLGKVDPHEDARPSFFEFLDGLLKELESQGMRKSTLKPYKVHVRVLKDFAEEQGAFTYEDVDWNFRLKLIDWLAAKKVQVSYGNKTLRKLRHFLERARHQNLHTNTQYHGNGWLIIKKKAAGQKVVLHPKELQQLADMPLSGYLKKVRDIFLIGAGTGQRFSDYSRFEPHHFYQTAKGTAILSLIAQKTDIPAKIPLNIFPWLLPILEEYEFSSPPLSMQKLNDGLKILGKKAGFDEKILVVEQLMGRKPQVVKKYVPKYQVLSTHCCRRSFATNLYRMGYSLAQIMPMTGHATEAHLRVYIGIDAEENAEKVALDVQNRREHKQ